MREFLAGTAGNTRAFIKVQDAVTTNAPSASPPVRGAKAKARQLGGIIAEIQALTAAGYQEAVLSGVHMGGSGYDFGDRTGLMDWCRPSSTHTDIPRCACRRWNLGHCAHLHAREDPRLLPHLHMPLRSGSDRILRQIARPTSQVNSADWQTRPARPPAPQPQHRPHRRFPPRTEADSRKAWIMCAGLVFRGCTSSATAAPGTAAAKVPDQPQPRRENAVNV